MKKKIKAYAVVYHGQQAVERFDINRFAIYVDKPIDIPIEWLVPVTITYEVKKRKK